MKIQTTLMQAGRVCIGALALVLVAALITGCGGRQQEAPPAQPAEPILPPSVPETHLMVEEDTAVEEEADEPDIVAMLQDDGLVDMSQVVPREEWAMSEEEASAVVSDWLREMEMDGVVQAARPGETLPLPENFPEDVSLPTGLEVRALQVSSEEGLMMLQGGAPQSVNELTEFFLKEGYDNDWTIGEQSQQSSPLEQMRIVRLEKEGRSVEVNLIESDRFTETQLTIILRGQ